MPISPTPGSTVLDILIVDDNPINLIVAREMVRSLGHRPTTVTDGESAVKAVITGRWALVLMDLSMPGMDGLTASERIRTWEKGSHRRVPLIALTAHTAPSIRAVCLSRGMDYYLAKPLTKAALEEVIRIYGGGLAPESASTTDLVVDAEGLASLTSLPAAIAQDLVRRFVRDSQVCLANLAEALGKDPGLMEQESVRLRGMLAQVGARKSLRILDRIAAQQAINPHLLEAELVADLTEAVHQAGSALGDATARAATSPG